MLQSPSCSGTDSRNNDQCQFNQQSGWKAALEITVWGQENEAQLQKCNQVILHVVKKKIESLTIFELKQQCTH